MRRPSRRLSLALVVVLVVAGVGAWQGKKWWDHRCGADAESVDAADVPSFGLRAPDAVDLEVGLDGLADKAEKVAARQRVLESAEETPFGKLAAARFLDHDDDLPSIGARGQVEWAAWGGGLPGSSFDGVVARVDLGTGKAEWGLGFGGYAPGGGSLGDHFVTGAIPRDRAPQVAVYDPESGDRTTCVELGEDHETHYDPTLEIGAVGDDEALVAFSSGDQLRLARVDLEEGETEWDEQVDDLDSVDDFTIAGDVAVLSRFGTRWGDAGRMYARFRTLRERPDLASEAHTLLSARSLDEGREVWRHDSQPGVPTVMGVVGGDDETVVALELTCQCETDAGRDHEVARVIAFDRDGEVAWRRTADFGMPVGVADDQVVVMSSRKEWTTYAGYDMATGKRLWHDRIKPLGGMARGVNDGAELDGRWLLPSSRGVLVVDPAAGSVELIDLRAYVSDVAVSDEHVVVSASNALLVFDR